MITVVGVRFKKAGKIYYFDPDGMDIEEGDCAIVETARGIEFGHVIVGPKEVSEEEIVPPLKKVLRIAGEEDHRIHQMNIQQQYENFLKHGFLVLQEYHHLKFSIDREQSLLSVFVDVGPKKYFG